jgi:hypothetical protein
MIGATQVIPARSRRGYAPIVVYALLAVGAAIVAAIGADDPRTEFVAVTLLLDAYIGFEILRVRREDPESWLLNPAVLASLATFALEYGFTNFIYFDSQNRELIRAAELMQGDDIFVWLTRATWYVLSGSVAMWVAYRSGIAARLAQSIDRTLRLDRVLRQGEGLRWSVVWSCVGIAAIGRLAEIKLGIFGYSGDATQLVELANYRNLLTLASDLSTFALLLVAFDYFRRPTRRIGLLLATLTSYEVVVGVLEGFKGQVVMPVVIVGFAAFAIRGKVPIRFALLAILLFLPAYMVIEPFRRLRALDAEFDSMSLTYVVSSILAARKAVDPNLAADVAASVPVSVVSRVNLTSQAAVSMWYKTRFGVPPGAPPFLSKLLLAPAHAYVPRLLWPSKPLENIGAWYSQTIWMNPSEMQAEGMSPIGYLNFAGGWLAVVLGFAAIGVSQRIFYLLLVNRGAAALLVFCGLLAGLVIVDSSVNALFVNCFRLFPALLVLQRVVYRR